MKKNSLIELEREVETACRSVLDETLRAGAERMLQTAVELEVAEYINRHERLRESATGYRQVVRNGHKLERKIQTPLGNISVRQPRIDDRRDGHRFESIILPPYLRRSPAIEALIPLLYLKGVSSNDMCDALEAILGARPKGLSANTVIRLKEAWQKEFEEWNGRDPNHVWHVDLSAAPTAAGFWVPWLPFAAPQVWPFCWWVVAVVDHYSRRVMALGVFPQQPSSLQVRGCLGRAIAKFGKPRYIISDKGGQFWSQERPSDYERWCRRRKIKPRFGAVGKRGSIAVIERFLRTFKERCSRCIVVPFRRNLMQKEVDIFSQWFNENWPHEFLDGKTPHEAYYYLPKKSEEPRYEPRSRYPPNAPCASPQAPVRGSPGVKLELVVAHFQGRRHLPIVTLREVA